MIDDKGMMLCSPPTVWSAAVAPLEQPGDGACSTPVDALEQLTTVLLLQRWRRRSDGSYRELSRRAPSEAELTEAAGCLRRLAHLEVRLARMQNNEKWVAGLLRRVGILDDDYKYNPSVGLDPEVLTSAIGRTAEKNL